MRLDALASAACNEVLSRELMGLLALAILWVNTLLVVAAAWRPWQRVRAVQRRLRRSLLVGTATSTGVFARHVVQQVGRKAADDAQRQAILFHDQRSHSELLGGELQLDGESRQIAPDEETNAAVWISRGRQQETVAALEAEGFGNAWAAARKARGFVRQVALPIGQHDEVWLSEPSGDQGWLIADQDPRPQCRGRLVLLLVLALGALAAAAGVTVLALWPPLFGRVSMLGAALGVAYFLLVQPAGVSIRDRARLPHESWLRGSWVSVQEAGAEEDDPCD